MTRLPFAFAAAMLPLGVAGPVAAAPAGPSLDQAWDLYDPGRSNRRPNYLGARDMARDYQRINGPNFSAAFLVAVAECKIHPHLRSNAVAFSQLDADFVVPGWARGPIRDSIVSCTSPPPPPPSASPAGVGGSALTVGLPVAGIRDNKAEVPLRHPRPAPPRVVAAPVVAGSSSVVPAPASVGPASCRALDHQLARGPAANVTTIATLRTICARESAPATPPVAGPAAPPPEAALPPEVEAANAERRRRYLAARCREPYVWRDAFYLDRVCVMPQVRDDAADDNRHRAERRDPTGPYGPMTCVQGYVWRAARDGDTVCVVPERRDQAAADNAAAASRRVGVGVPGSG